MQLKHPGNSTDGGYACRLDFEGKNHLDGGGYEDTKDHADSRCRRRVEHLLHSPGNRIRFDTLRINRRFFSPVREIDLSKFFPPRFNAHGFN